MHSVHLVVDLTGGDAAAVRIEYVLAPSVTADRVDATALEFAGARVEEPRATDGSPVPVRRLRPLAAALSLPVSRAGGSGPSVVTVYAVPRAVSGHGASVRAHIPVVSVDLPPEAASPGLFSAEVRVPPRWRVAESFPTGLSPTDTPGLYRVDLAVVPAVLSFRARSDGRWRPGLPWVLDLLAFVLLLTFSAVGWRHLRNPRT